MAWSLTRIHGKVGTKILSEIALQGGTHGVAVVAQGTPITEDAVHHLLGEHEMTAIDVGSIERVSTSTRADSGRQRISTRVT